MTNYLAITTDTPTVTGCEACPLGYTACTTAVRGAVTLKCPHYQGEDKTHVMCAKAVANASRSIYYNDRTYDVSTVVVSYPTGPNRVYVQATHGDDARTVRNPRTLAALARLAGWRIRTVSNVVVLNGESPCI